MYYLIGIIIFLVITIITCIYFIYNLLHQNNQLEQRLADFATDGENVEKFYLVILKLLQNAYSEISRIDKKGSFSSDDEVGFSFIVLKNAMQNVVLQLQNLRKNDDTEKEET